MKKLLLSVAAATIAASFFLACSSGVSSSDVNNMLNGPNSIKGTISGTMTDNTPYSFNYDYHVTTNDGNSYSESQVDSNTGDSVLYVWQYFFFDSRGYSDYGDNYSASGQYVALEMNIKLSTMTIEPLNTTNDRYLEGMWQNITSGGNRFVYGRLRYCDCYDNSNTGLLGITNLKYDKGTQLLSGKLNLALPDNHGYQVNSGNQKATTITGDFKIYVPKENLLVGKKNSNGGNVYRKRSK